jgi:hypothetical protein
MKDKLLSKQLAKWAIKTNDLAQRDSIEQSYL